MRQPRRYGVQEVYDLLYENLYGFDDATKIILWSLAKIPARVIDRLSKKCLILVPAECETRGMHVPRKLLQGKEVIVLAEGIFNLPLEEAEWIVQHEVAHFWLRHKSSVLETMSNEDAERQESEADEQVAKWLGRKREVPEMATESAKS